MTTPIREATFAGCLNPNDYEVTGLGSDSPLVAINVRLGTPAGARRSPRPFAMASRGWRQEDAGLGFEDVCRKYAAEAAPLEGAALPGDALEVWLLPVVQFTSDYLITPAGDWPPAETP